MIDLKLLQKDFETLSAKLMRKGVDSTLLESLKTKNVLRFKNFVGTVVIWNVSGDMKNVYNFI